MNTGQNQKKKKKWSEGIGMWTGWNWRKINTRKYGTLKKKTKTFFKWFLVWRHTLQGQLEILIKNCHYSGWKKSKDRVGINIPATKWGKSWKVKGQKERILNSSYKFCPNLWLTQNHDSHIQSGIQVAHQSPKELNRDFSCCPLQRRKSLKSLSANVAACLKQNKTKKINTLHGI